MEKLLWLPCADRPFLLLTSLVARVSVSERIFSNLSFPVRKAILSPLGKGDGTSLGREQMILYLPLLLERPQLMGAMIKTYKPTKEKGTKSLLCPEGEPGVILSRCVWNSRFCRRALCPQGPQFSSEGGSFDWFPCFHLYLKVTIIKKQTAITKQFGCRRWGGGGTGSEVKNAMPFSTPQDTAIQSQVPSPRKASVLLL